MSILDKYWTEKTQYDAEHPVKMVKVLPQDNPNLNLSILKQNVDNIDNLQDCELKNFITRSYKTILLNLFTGKESTKYIKQFQNKRFLDAFIDVLSSSNDIESDDIIRINTLCYHYITIDKSQQDELVMNRMFKLSNIVNRYHLPGLLGLGLSNNLASILLIARFSDINLEVCIKRVNFIIITQPKELMTDKMIEEIMRKLYDVMNLYYNIFPYLMMDTIPEYDETNENTLWVTEEIDEVNSVLNLAILDILDNLPSPLIRSTILNYSEGQRMVHHNKPVRFSLRNLSADYYRINNIVNQLIYDEGIDVP